MHCMDVRKSPKSNRALHPLLEINNIWQNYPVQAYSAFQIAVIKWSLIKLQTANELTAYKGWAMYQLIKINTYLTFLKLYQYSPHSDWVPFAGESPAKWDFPRQSHSVDARRDFSRWSHQTCSVRRGESDLGLVIDIAQLFSSNVRMCQMWWHCDLTQPKPLSRDCPRKVGAFENTVWTVGRKKDKTSPNCPR